MSFFNNLVFFNVKASFAVSCLRAYQLDLKMLYVFISGVLCGITSSLILDIKQIQRRAQNTYVFFQTPSSLSGVAKVVAACRYFTNILSCGTSDSIQVINMGNKTYDCKWVIEGREHRSIWCDRTLPPSPIIQVIDENGESHEKLVNSYRDMHGAITTNRLTPKYLGIGDVTVVTIQGDEYPLASDAAFSKFFNL